MRTPSRVHSRRSILGLLAAAGAAVGLGAHAGTLPPVKVSKVASCGCCSAWADHLRTAGFPVEIVELDDLDPVKAALGVPDELASCHTAEMAGYVVEGHVPVHAILRLLAEKPSAIGLAVPGMPTGSPGMEGGEPEVYEVTLFGKAGTLSYGRYRGAEPV